MSKIPIEEICDLISDHFGLGIEKEVDRTLYSIVDLKRDIEAALKKFPPKTESDRHNTP